MVQAKGAGASADRAIHAVRPLGRPLVPWVAVAVPLALPGAAAGDQLETLTMQGLAFCGAPLSANPTGLPIHIDGALANFMRTVLTCHGHLPHWQVTKAAC